MFGESTYEKAECKMLTYAIQRAIENAGAKEEDVDMLISGDLLNQIISASFAARDFDFPFLGVYGACSTMAESLCLASMLVDGSYLRHAVCTASSHFCTAERQYRFPLEYGSQRPPTAQWTVTGAGSAVVSGDEKLPAICRATHVTLGRIVDMAIKDANNMGAAMAPAAYDTLTAHFKDTGREPQYYDAIITGDLGKFGHSILSDFFSSDGLKMPNVFTDCGMLIYNTRTQDTHCGGSGCGCAASVLCGHIIKCLREGMWKRVLFAPTGALMSPVSSMQGESIPGICHALAIEMIEDK
jgi:stage V sporulation protein AD